MGRHILIYMEFGNKGVCSKKQTLKCGNRCQHVAQWKRQGSRCQGEEQTPIPSRRKEGYFPYLLEGKTDASGPTSLCFHRCEGRL